jgi:D-glycero-alpha-D-manno-heptose-7-phosphate kinase
MYLSIHPLFDDPKILLKYSRMEYVSEPKNLLHPIAKEILSEFKIRGVDISVSADVPAGSGLGSSSAFTVGLYNLIAAYRGGAISKAELASAACDIEIYRLQEPIGMQDQYASAFGGLNLFKFEKSGQVEIKEIPLTNAQLEEFNSSLYLVKTSGESRSASNILKSQRHLASRSESIENAMIEMKELALTSVDDIAKDIFKISDYVNRSWHLKKLSNPSTSNVEIDDIIATGLRHGALAAKLLGAGESGFVLFICRPRQIEDLKASLPKYKFLKVAMDKEGSKLIYDDGIKNEF